MDTQETEVELKGVARPDLSALSEAVADYLLHLESRITALAAEMEAKPGAEARGWCWFNLYGAVKGAGEERHLVQGSAGVRSDVDMQHAIEQAMGGLRFAKGTFKMVPYIPGSASVIGGGNGGSAKGQETDKTFPTEKQPAGRRRSGAEPAGEPPREGSGKRRGSAEPAKTGTAEAIGQEQWVKVNSLSVEWADKAKTTKCVRVKTTLARFAQYGVPAYFDSGNIPEDILDLIENKGWAMDDPPVTGKELSEDFTDMQFALISADGKRVVGWAEKPPA